VQEHIAKLNPLATIYVAVFQAVSRAAVRENSALIYVPWGRGGATGRTVIVAESPYVVDDFGNTSPVGIRYFVASAAPDKETAMRYLVYAAQFAHTCVQLSANAMAFPLQLRLMTIWHPGIVPYRELIFEPQISHPINTRLIDIGATGAFCSGVWLANEDRIARAMTQYEIALRRLHDNELPLAIAHIYMGVETITKAIVRLECEERGVDETGLGIALKLDPQMDRFGAALEKLIRADIIFQGDAASYKNARAVSDGIEHGFASWEEIWSFDLDGIFDSSARYLRAAVLRALRIPSEIQTTLRNPPFDSQMEAGPKIAYEGKATISKIDLRANDFSIAHVQRKMDGSVFDSARGEYRFAYSLRPTS
jgi:hypothetical protein